MDLNSCVVGYPNMVLWYFCRVQHPQHPAIREAQVRGSVYKVGNGYILGLPVAACLTWQGRMLENNGIVQKFSIELSREVLKQGKDTQLGTAIEVSRAL